MRGFGAVCRACGDAGALRASPARPTCLVAASAGGTPLARGWRRGPAPAGAAPRLLPYRLCARAGWAGRFRGVVAIPLRRGFGRSLGGGGGGGCGAVRAASGCVRMRGGLCAQGASDRRACVLFGRFRCPWVTFAGFPCGSPNLAAWSCAS